MVFPYWEKPTVTVLLMDADYYKDVCPCTHTQTHPCHWNANKTWVWAKNCWLMQSSDLKKNNPIILNSKDINWSSQCTTTSLFTELFSWTAVVHTIVGPFVKTQGKKVLSWDFCPCPFWVHSNRNHIFLYLQSERKIYFIHLKTPPLLPKTWNLFPERKHKDIVRHRVCGCLPSLELSILLKSVVSYPIS